MRSESAPMQQTWREHGHLLLVADGMGGHAVGELASKIAADTVCHTFFKLRDLDVVDALRTIARNGQCRDQRTRLAQSRFQPRWGRRARPSCCVPKGR